MQVALSRSVKGMGAVQKSQVSGVVVVVVWVEVEVLFMALFTRVRRLWWVERISAEKVDGAWEMWGMWERVVVVDVARR